MFQNELSSFGDWELKRRLGSGGFGQVLHWQHRLTKQEIATKLCSRDRNSMHDDEVDKLKKRWLQEHNWMRNLNTEYIVRGVDVADRGFLAYLNEQHGAWRPLPVIVMEYCNGGDLRALLQRPEHCNGLSEHEVRQAMHALRCAVEYLHTECQIEHRDLKPDNIVLHCVAGRKTYKLTDFGFSRTAVEHTTKASIVGTQNYFAPEIIVHSLGYTKTVDYWSMGVIAFELMCGQLPFIPHQTLKNKIEQIRAKPDSCIAITEDPAAADRFAFESRVFGENRVSRTFQARMESWLRLALDTNFRTRGTVERIVSGSGNSERTLVIYTALDEILQSKVLTVFSMNTYQFCSFELTPGMTMPELCAEIEEATGLERKDFYMILPIGHPQRQITAQTRPEDLYVEAWLDTSLDSGNPPAMLYLHVYLGAYRAPEPQITPLIRHCLLMGSGGADGGDRLRLWVLRQLVVQTHHLLSSEQRHLEALLCGLHGYALSVEEEIFHYEQEVASYVALNAMVQGRVKQFNVMVEQAKIAANRMQSCEPSASATWAANIAKFNKEVQVQITVQQSIEQHFRSVNRRVKEVTKNPLFSDLINRDAYKVKELRQQMVKWQQYPDEFHMLSMCQDLIYACLEQRNQLLSNISLKYVQGTVSDVHKEFRKTADLVKDAKKRLHLLEQQLDEATAKFPSELMEKPNCGSTSLAGLQNGESLSLSLDDVLNLPPTNHLVEDTRHQLHLFEMLIDEDLVNLPSIFNN